MGSICAGITRSGSRCSATVGPGQTHCYLHDSSKAEERRRAASRAGKSRPSREIRGVKDRLLSLADDVLAGEADRANAAVAAQIMNVYLRACETERRTSDLGDLLERLEHVEEAASRFRGA